MRQCAFLVRFSRVRPSVEAGERACMHGFALLLLHEGAPVAFPPLRYIPLVNLFLFYLIFSLFFFFWTLLSFVELLI
jgi:hypothetical protein